MGAKEKRGYLFSKSIIIVAILTFVYLFCFVSAISVVPPIKAFELSNSTYTFTSQLASQGITQGLELGNSIQFSRKTNSLYETYTVTLNQVSDNSVDLIMQNDQSHISLNLGETKKMSLSSSGFYDLLIKLESVSDGKAEITLQTIHELIPTQSILLPTNETSINLTENNTKSSNFFTKTNIIIIAIVLVAVLFILYIRNLRRRLRSFQPVHHGSYRIVK